MAYLFALFEWKLDLICMYTKGSSSLNFSEKLQLNFRHNRIKALYCIWHDICVQNYWILYSDISLEYRDKKNDLIHLVYLFQDHPSVLCYLFFFQFHFKSAISLEDYFTAY